MTKQVQAVQDIEYVSKINPYHKPLKIIEMVMKKLF